MEKRWSERKAIQIGVDMYQHGEKLATGYSWDVSLGGTFFALDAPPALAKGSAVELIFHLHPESFETKHRLHVRVTRVADNGIGFKFHNFDTGVFRALQEILSCRGTVQRSARA